MEEQERELEEAPEPLDNPDEEQVENDTPENEEETDEPESSEAEKPEKSDDKEIKSLIAQKEHWRKKALEIEKKLPKPKPAGSNESEWKNKVEFLLENRDITDDEFEHLAAVASRRSGSITIESLRDAQEQEKDYISYKRKQLESKKKVPGSTATGFESKKKSAKEIAAMSNEEFKAYEAELSQMPEKSGI